MEFVIIWYQIHLLEETKHKLTKEDKPDKMPGSFFQNLFLNTAYDICGKFCKGIRNGILKFRGR